jgi:hypothetical protein
MATAGDAIFNNLAGALFSAAQGYGHTLRGKKLNEELVYESHL